LPVVFQVSLVVALCCCNWCVDLATILFALACAAFSPRMRARGMFVTWITVEDAGIPSFVVARGLVAGRRASSAGRFVLLWRCALSLSFCFFEAIVSWSRKTLTTWFRVILAKPLNNAEAYNFSSGSSPLYVFDFDTMYGPGGRRWDGMIAWGH
jgi:hypothetical protein